MSTDVKEYTDAYTALIEFRRKIFAEVVSGRVKAKLDANHLTLQKFSNVIDRMTVTPYMFNNVKQKAIALQLDLNEVGKGEIHQPRATYSGDKTDYPLLDISNPATMNVAQRSLPSVDVFRYNPVDNLTLVETSNESVWANLFILQADISSHLGGSDLDNAFYSYWHFHPVGRVKCTVTLTSPEQGFNAWSSLKGEATKLIAIVTSADLLSKYVFVIWVIVDGQYYRDDTQITGIVPLAMLIPKPPEGTPEVIINAGGKRMSSADKAVYCDFALESQQVGWSKTHSEWTIVDPVTLWAKSVNIIIDANDENIGTTNPPFGLYPKKATDTFTATETPNVGSIFDHWEVDNVYSGSGDSIDVDCYKDSEVTAFFYKGQLIYARPISNTSFIELIAFQGGANWDCVDEVIANDGTDFVYNNNFDHWYRDIYNLTVRTIPSQATINRVTCHAKCFATQLIDFNHMKFVLKSGSTEFLSEGIIIPQDSLWHSLTKTYDKSPFTGVAWTPSEVNALLAGISLQCRGGHIPHMGWMNCCTQFFITIEAVT